MISMIYGYITMLRVPQTERYELLANHYLMTKVRKVGKVYNINNIFATHQMLEI
jgi:hypothetical protein